MSIVGEQFRDPMFKGCFTLFVSDFAAVLTHLREREFDTQGEVPRAAKTIKLERDGCCEIILWFPADTSFSEPASIALLAHEALHGVQFSLERIGAGVATILDEVGNYYLEWLVNEIVTRWQKSLDNGAEKVQSCPYCYARAVAGAVD